MFKRFCLVAFMIASAAGCASSVQMSGTADDGETFQGTADDTDAYATSGPVQIVSSRGATCMGRFKYEGIVGPAGKMTFICSDGRSGEATMHGVWNGVARGTIGGKPFTMKWVSGV